MSAVFALTYAEMASALTRRTATSANVALGTIRDLRWHLAMIWMNASKTHNFAKEAAASTHKARTSVSVRSDLTFLLMDVFVLVSKP